MYTGNVWGIALLISGFLATLIGFQLLVAALTPVRSAQALRALRERRAGTLLSGVVTILVLGAVVALLSNLGGPGKFFSGVVLAIASFKIAGGLAVVSRFVGEAMPAPVDSGSPWRATLRGGVTCGLAFVVPLVGWFLVLPLAIVMGVGALVLSRLSPSRAPAGTQPVPSESGAAA
jgi:hypothetical protein